MSRLPRLLLAACLLNAVAGAALAADVIVDKDPPPLVQARFFERIRAGALANAIAKRGTVVHVPAGKYHLQVPCDTSKPGSFNDVAVTVKEGSLTRLRLLECGVEIRVKTVFH